MTKTILLLVNEITKKEYELKQFKDGKALLKGKTAEWWEPYDPVVWEKLGYKKVKREVTDD